MSDPQAISPSVSWLSLFLRGLWMRSKILIVNEWRSYIKSMHDTHPGVFVRSWPSLIASWWALVMRHLIRNCTGDRLHVSLLLCTWFKRSAHSFEMVRWSWKTSETHWAGCSQEWGTTGQRHMNSKTSPPIWLQVNSVCSEHIYKVLVTMLRNVWAVGLQLPLKI